MPLTAIIQARMGSTRLPGKVMADIAGLPMLRHVVERVRAADIPVVVATSHLNADAPIRAYCHDNDIDYSSGDEKDVLSRYYQAALEYDADPAMRITADCPLLDPNVLTELRTFYLSSECDYAGVVTGDARQSHRLLGREKLRRFPDGLDAEIFSVNALRHAWACALTPHDREHVTSYIYNNPVRPCFAEGMPADIGTFRCDYLWAPGNYGRRRWTVDTQEDLDFVRRAYAALFVSYDQPHGSFGLTEMLAWEDAQ